VCGQINNFRASGFNSTSFRVFIEPRVLHQNPKSFRVPQHLQQHPRSQDQTLLHTGHLIKVDEVLAQIPCLFNTAERIACEVDRVADGIRPSIPLTAQIILLHLNQSLRMHATRVDDPGQKDRQFPPKRGLQ
jgi:hypothetical protein